MKKKVMSVLLSTMVGMTGLTTYAQEATSPEAESVLSAYTDDLYEPETSVIMPATIVWPADETAQNTAAEEVRPETMIVAVDQNLTVSTLEGAVISESLTEYLETVKTTTLPALYIRDEESAEALKNFVQENEVRDIFVAADNAHAGLVKMVTDASSNVLGIIDYTDAEVDTTRESLGDIVSLTNANHAKIALIPEEIATRETVDYLRGRLTTVWVETSSDEKAIYTQLTNGANGIVCADYAAVVEALESFDGEAAVQLRQPFIAGHRGLPSQYIENTIRSERGAIEAGANVIECDIYLSADGEIFVLHDETAERLFNRADITDVEALTIEELKALEFDVTDDTKENAPNSVLNANNENRTKEGREDMVLDIDTEVDRIPTLREYLEAFREDEDVIHFIEIKSVDRAIVAPFKALVEEMGMEDRVVVITFNDGYDWKGREEENYHEELNILEEMHETWPEMPLGYLGYDGYNCADLTAMVEENDGLTGEAIGNLYETLQPYNATCNWFYGAMNYDVIFSGRHRGLTAWPWTYNTEDAFADAYLKGIYGLTTNYSTWATDYPVKIEAEDVEIGTEGAQVPCTVYTQAGEEIIPEEGSMELVQISGPELSVAEDGTVQAQENGEAVVLYRMNLTLDVNGADLSELGNLEYVIYSNPFTITVNGYDA
ncbi:MAG: glycerophosphodiester phosphodiesterase family protein [Lachnospiraceae bacterium]|nr:glycerophosphodiester phosphodiesterase family protein [Lachnospiraceae bacterium]